MFFEGEKDNLENFDNLDGIDLDLGDETDDDSIDWDELLKEDDEQELVSVAADKVMPAAQESVVSVKTEAEPEFKELSQEETPSETKEDKKDAFEVFGGSDEQEELLDVELDDDTDQTDADELPDENVDMDDLTDEEYLKQVSASQDKNNRLPVLLGIALAAAVVLGAFMYFGNKPKAPQLNFKATKQIVKPQVIAPTSDTAAVEKPAADENVGDIPVVGEKEAKTLKPEKKITVSVESAGRINPFLPTSVEFSKDIYSGIPSQSLLPPDAYGEDMDAQNLMRVSVSGILFDNVKPSAIITINDMDYFVQKGDIVDDYKVLDINRQAVVVKKGANVYKAGVGEMLNRNFEISDGGGMVGTYENGARRYVSVSESEVEVKTKSNTRTNTRTRSRN